MDVSVIVLNFNGESLLPAALSSLSGQTVNSIEILVADNGSTDTSAEVAHDFGARFLPLGYNYGFSVANNFAAEQARGAYLFFVNNDMRFAPDCVESLARTLEGSSRIFAADCVQYEWGTRRIVHGGTVLRRGTWRSKPLPFVEVDPVGLTDRFSAVPWTCAGNMMVRKWMFDKLAGFDPSYFMNGEDVDICLRAWMEGWASVFVPPTASENWVEHKIGATNRRLRDWRLARTTGNYVRLLLKNANAATAARDISSIVASNALGVLRSGLADLTGTALGLLWNVYLARDTWARRRLISSRRRYRFEDVLGLFVQRQGSLDPDEVIRELDEMSQRSIQ